MPHCHAVIEHSESIIAALLAAGFFGGFTHCMGMCGPFVMAQVTARGQNISPSAMGKFTRLQGAALLPYHLGRITTYILFAVIGTVFATKITDGDLFQSIAATLLFIAGIGFITRGGSTVMIRIKDFLLSLSGIGFIYGFILRKIYKRFFTKLSLGFIVPKQLIQNLNLNPTGINGYILGIILGFLPCGLVYASLAAAISASGGDPLRAAIAMGVFGFATIPALFIFGLGSGFILNRYKTIFNKIANIVMIVSGITLITIAIKLFF